MINQRYITSPKFHRNRTHYKKRHQHRARRSSTELLSWRQSRLRRHRALTDRHLKSRCNCYRSHFLQSAPRLCSPQICQMWNEDLLWEERPFCFSSNLFKCQHQNTQNELVGLLMNKMKNGCCHHLTLCT